MKLNPLVKDLRLYDVVEHTPGVAKDLEHICSFGAVSGFWDPISSKDKPQLLQALKGANLVLIPAGVPRKPGMSRDDLFGINASIVAGLCKGIAAACPDAFVGIISNPVNSTVPIAAEVLKKAGCFDPKRLFGITELDLTRSKSFYSDLMGQRPEHVTVPVIGGHSGVTIVPLLSQATPQADAETSKTAFPALVKRIQSAGTEVVKLKAGKGSATLSMAYSASAFATACLKALGGKPQVAYAYVQSKLIPHVPFFASKVTIGSRGIEEFSPIGLLSKDEQVLLEAAIKPLQDSIKKGVSFVKANM